MKNFGPISDITWDNLGPINLVIGENGSGKSFLLKALYCPVRTLEEYRGNNIRTTGEILAEKLHWTFQAEKIGDLVAKGGKGSLYCQVASEGHAFKYKFGKDTSKQISLTNDMSPRKSNSVFLPAKEVLSLFHIIQKSREIDKTFGFDDTYLDLVRALSPSPKKGKNYDEFSTSRKELESIIGGKTEYDESSGSWHFKKGNQKFPIGVAAEGIKKIAILDILLGNRYLDRDSIIFIDELESALHPTAISKFLDIVAKLAERGIQFFIASHSYFVVKKLYLIAQEKGISIPVISLEDKQGQCADLKDGMPDNPIINESIRLYEEEVELALS